MSTPWVQYITERLGKKVLENEFGFLVYTIKGEECFVEEIYVFPEHRLKGKGTEFGNWILETATLAGCTHLSCTVVPSAKGATDSLKAILTYGFEVHSSHEDLIVLVRKV